MVFVFKIKTKLCFKLHLVFHNKVVSLQNFPKWLCLHTQVRLLFVKHTSHFLSISQTNLITLFSALVVDKHVWMRKGFDRLANLKTTTAWCLVHVCLGWFLSSSEIPFLKCVFLCDRAVLKAALIVRVFESLANRWDILFGCAPELSELPLFWPF